MHKLAKLDQRYLWHPFTQMQDWLEREPTVIVGGQGAILRDAYGREYLDANASIWTNLHGHRHPRINAALRRQLGKVAHSSALGLANEPASILGEELVRLANPLLGPEPVVGRKIAAPGEARLARTRSASRAAVPVVGSVPGTTPNPSLSRVFFSDDGSTALEVALKLAYEFARRSGRSKSPRFLSLDGAYHGDTTGAVSLGHIDLFHKAYSGLLFKTDSVMAPYCYRCPFNRAKPERADARLYRQCHWECTQALERRLALHRKRGNPIAALIVEPLMQGAAGMIPQPEGWLRQAAELVRADGAQLIADEVMTGFGRTGTTFASHREGVQPDFLAVAKGLTGGYLPMAATLTTDAVFDAFLGDYSEFKTFFHGHSFTANQLGAAAALASLELLETPSHVRSRLRLEKVLSQELARLWTLPNVGDIRQVGLVVGIELVRDWKTRAPFDLRERVGIRVCEGMSRRGVLTRPVGNVIVLMPPYCTTPKQISRIIQTLAESIDEAGATT
jgi:adenosylmethionine-8-amino-7-oxononanoate aminotransferase